jgi:N-formylmaleamate deformylase
MSNWSQGDVLANGIKIHYYRTGSGERPPLVLAHGFTDNGLCWTPFAEAMEGEYDIIMYDARGHGLSDAPEGDYYSYTLQAADLAGLVEALGLRKPALLGHSMGAATIGLAAATYPDLASCILLEDPPLRGADFVLLPIEEQEVLVREARAKTIAGKAKSRDEIIAQSRTEFPAWPEAERGPWAEAKQQLSPNVFNVQRVLPPDWREIIPRIACPILLLTGDPELGGIVTPEIAAEAGSLWRVGQVAHIPNTGHSIRRENFERYVEVARAFLQDNATGV